ncbi:subunit E of vacuolar ATP synthase [Chloropicon primus]|uniref:Subunit E of vacuolar ATP synthase n=1 Tax=Chloropicon primus TaxID=1764295 RepID=A0A5B8MEU2_9CHLO|nr:subunit E of vacuolar ATP synthase [Chloropicon primus]|eukprot:QDZ18973.1 subunit E of vacuolar ATP synthase [Chloropicon primus]
MNEQEVAVQISQMVQFIRKEAEEKANEIRAAAQEEYTIQKQTVVEAEKAKIRKEYERKRSQIDTKKAIESSTQLNTARLKVLQAQQDAIDEAIESARTFLPRVAANPAEYKKLVLELLVQAVKRFGPGSDLRVRCLQRDAGVVQESIEAARSQYAAATNSAAPSVALDSLSPLADCMGGLIVSTADGKIVCDNTLDARLAIVAKQALPELRKVLFPENEGGVSLIKV